MSAMPINRARRSKDVPVRIVLPRPVEERLKRIEDLLIEMRAEQDMLLKRFAKAQAQLDELAGKRREAPRERFQN